MGFGIRARPARISSRSGMDSMNLYSDQLGVEADGAARRACKIAEMQALVFRVCVGVGIFHTDEQRGSAAQLAREGIDEGDRSAAADADRLASVAILEGLARRAESR